MREFARGGSLSGESKLEIGFLVGRCELVQPDDLDGHGAADGGIEAAEDGAHGAAT